MKSILNYIKESILELHHVTWPTQHQMVRLSLISLVFCAITAVIIGIIDYAFSIGITTLINL